MSNLRKSQVSSLISKNIDKIQQILHYNFVNPNKNIPNTYLSNLLYYVLHN